MQKNIYPGLCILLLFFVGSAYAICNPVSTGHSSINADGDIYDSKTGLIWKKCLQGFSGTNCETPGVKTTFTWNEALGQADNTWRLPNIKELQSIVEEGCASPAINPIFPGTHTTGVWSNSPLLLLLEYYPNHSLYVAFNKNGEVLPAGRTETFHVRLVRDAPTE